MFMVNTIEINAKQEKENSNDRTQKCVLKGIARLEASEDVKKRI